MCQDFVKALPAPREASKSQWTIPTDTKMLATEAMEKLRPKQRVNDPSRSAGDKSSFQSLMSDSKDDATPDSAAFGSPPKVEASPDMIKKAEEILKSTGGNIEKAREILMKTLSGGAGAAQFGAAPSVTQPPHTSPSRR